MKRRLICTQIAVAAGTLLCFAQAQAAHVSNYPGGMCVPNSTNGIYARFAGTICNGSTASGPTSALELFCPFVKQSTSIVSASFTAFSRHDSTSVFCTLFADTSDSSGHVFVASSFKAAPFGSSATQTMNFGPLTNFTGNYYYAICTIPAISSNGLGPSDILQFSINEP